MLNVFSSNSSESFDPTGLIILAGVILIILIVFICHIRIVKQAEKCVVERLGSYHTTWGNGIHFLFPILDKLVEMETLEELEYHKCLVKLEQLNVQPRNVYYDSNYPNLVPQANSDMKGHVHQREWDELNVADENGDLTEVTSQYVGFRRFEMQDGVMILNGKPISYKGINRDTFSADRECVLNREETVKDIVTMKQNNINAVCTSSYLDDSDTYELCDEYGVYMMVENLLDEENRWYQSYKNHPCIMMLSEEANIYPQLRSII